MRSGRLPDFLAVGPPRTATTWLHHLLKGRANLPERSKETHFFDERFRWGLRWYARHFEHARPGIPTGEMAPTYFHSAAARERIAASLPGVKIIISLREPVERLYSLYRLKVSTGAVTGSFLECLRSDPEMVESARYVSYLSEWSKTFGRDRVLIVIYDDLLLEPVEYARRIFGYLGLEWRDVPARDFARVHSSESVPTPRYPAWTNLAIRARESLILHDASQTRKVLKRFRIGSVLDKILKRSGPPIAPLDEELAAALRNQFKSEVEGVEKILGYDLPAWKRT